MSVTYTMLASIVLLMTALGCQATGTIEEAPRITYITAPEGIRFDHCHFNQAHAHDHCYVRDEVHRCDHELQATPTVVYSQPSTMIIQTRHSNIYGPANEVYFGSLHYPRAAYNYSTFDYWGHPPGAILPGGILRRTILPGVMASASDSRGIQYVNSLQRAGLQPAREFIIKSGIVARMMITNAVADLMIAVADLMIAVADMMIAVADMMVAVADMTSVTGTLKNLAAGRTQIMTNHKLNVVTSHNRSAAPSRKANPSDSNHPETKNTATKNTTTTGKIQNATDKASIARIRDNLYGILASSSAAQNSATALARISRFRLSFTCHWFGIKRL